MEDLNSKSLPISNFMDKHYQSIFILSLKILIHNTLLYLKFAQIPYHKNENQSYCSVFPSSKHFNPLPYVIIISLLDFHFFHKWLLHLFS